eukprot:COSAG06_NODE_65859_length_256_cov_0.503185_1_plen_21_part_10
MNKEAARAAAEQAEAARAAAE